MTAVSDRVMHSDLARELFGEGFGAPVEVGRFVVLDRLGGGGMGVVYRAYDPKLARRVALKVLRRGPGQHPRAAERLRQEAVGLAKLAHPNVVAVHEVGEVAGETYVAMEYVEGVELGRWATKNPPRTDERFETARRLLLQAGRGLAAAHKAGLVHRDVKPGNVLVGDDGRVRVVDFGLVRTTVETPDPSGDVDVALSTFAGTPAYMSPEQQQGATVDASSDQFSFCVTAWEVLFGARPWPERPRAQTPPDAPDGAPSWIVKILQRGLSEYPRSRFPSMGALLAALRVDPRSRRRRRRIAAGALVTAATAAAAYFWHDAQACNPAALPQTGGPLARHGARLQSTAQGICRMGRAGALATDDLAAAQGCLALQRADHEAIASVASASDLRGRGWSAVVAGLRAPESCWRATDTVGALPAGGSGDIETYRTVRAAQFLWDAGELAGAREHFESARAIIDAANDPAVRASALRFQSEVAAAEGDAETARSTARAGYEGALAQGQRWIAATFAARLASLAQQRDDAYAAGLWRDHARWLR